MTTPDDLALLQQIAEALAASPDGTTDTAALAAASGRATFGPPWFEMEGPLRALEAEGLLRIRASADQAGEATDPSPASERIALALTPEGREALAPRNSG